MPPSDAEQMIRVSMSVVRMCRTSDGEEGGLATVAKVIELTRFYSGTVNMTCALGSIPDPIWR